VFEKIVETFFRGGDWIIYDLFSAEPPLPNLPISYRAHLCRRKSSGALGTRCQVCGTPMLHGGANCPYTGKFEIGSRQLEQLLAQHDTGEIHFPDLLLGRLRQLAQPDELRRMKQAEAEQDEQTLLRARSEFEEMQARWKREERYWTERERVEQEKAERRKTVIVG